jgi:raffinose synthase
MNSSTFLIVILQDFAPGYKFAPLGLIGMYNGGGAVESLTYHRLDGVKLIELDSSSVAREIESSLAVTESAGSEAVAMVCMEVKGCGRFGSYSSAKPRKCLVGSSEVEFTYDSSNGLLVIQLESMPKERVHKVVIEI